MAVGYTRIGVEHDNTHTIYQAAPPEDEQVMLETYRGP
jgi:hypothetical protein